MKTITQIRFVTVLLCLAFLTLGINYIKLQRELDKCQLDKNFISGGDIEKSELNLKIDSLKNEIFVKDLQVGSYEVMWGILEEINKPLADSINLLVE